MIAMSTSDRRAWPALLLGLWWLQAAAAALAATENASPSPPPAPAPAGTPPQRLDLSFFLKQILDKYGHDGIMTFEGFEHLLDSLGLGRLEFDRRHGVSLHRAEDGSFREVHDAMHLHSHAHDPAASNSTPTGEERGRSGDWDEAHPPRARRSPQARGNDLVNRDASSQCLSPREMLMGFGLPGTHGVAIDANSFLMLCPVIVYELDQRTCYFTKPPTPQRRGPHPAAWRLASLSVLAASAVGLAAAAAGGLLLGCSRRALPALDVLVAVGAGTLCGDALLHLLPHVFADHGGDSEGSGDGGETHGHSQGPVLRAAAAFATIAALFALEALLRRRGRGHSHSHAQEDGKDGRAADAWRPPVAINEAERGDEKDGSGAALAVVAGGAGADAAGAHGHSHGKGTAAGVWMVLLGDGVHNLTDGLAVGAAFCDDPVAGFATALAVFCHELPHEFGDFAALLKSGMSVRKALFYNVLSSVLSFVGMAIGLLVGNLDEASQWIYAITAGSFIYIALVDLVPDLIRNTSQSVTIATSCLQLLGIFIGGGIMLVIALYEDVLRKLFQ